MALTERRAEAICEAVGRPSMHFVAVKSEEQQAVLMVHRARALAVATRTALANQIRGLLGEFGIVIPVGIARLRRDLPRILGDAENGLPAPSHQHLRAKCSIICVDSFTSSIGRSPPTMCSFASWPEPVSLHGD